MAYNGTRLNRSMRRAAPRIVDARPIDLIGTAQTLRIEVSHKHCSLGSGDSLFPLYHQPKIFCWQFGQDGHLTRIPAMAPARDSLAGELQRGTTPGFASAKTRFGMHDVVARDRHDALTFGELNLKHHHVVPAECRFRTGKVEFPHPHEAGVVKTRHLVAVGEETVAPRLEGLSVMKPQDFDVGDEETGTLDRRYHLG